MLRNSLTTLVYIAVQYNPRNVPDARPVLAAVLYVDA
jgi:hypothetical protein